MLKQISQCSLLKPIGTNSINLPTPLNISLWWNLGSMLSVALMVQILTGLFLASHYSPWTDSAFDSIININREVTGGWLMRALHANGASLFFVFLYLHISRGLYYGSYTKHKVWNVGVLIFIISMATAFVGYVLVWGQMSFWGATVITNLLSAIPYVGSYIVYWLWGGFGVANATLNRFFVFHFILPFIIAAGAVTHLILLHDKGSANPTGLAPSSAKILFQPYFSAKDVKGFMILFLMYGALTLLAPMFFLDSENFLPANPGVTPEHIKPEWYFLWAYAILRSIPDKLSGVIMMFAAILILFALPKMWRANMGALHHYPSAKMVFWFLVSSMLLLTWIGGCPIEDPYVILGRLFTGWLFLAYFSIPMVIKSYDLMLWPSEPILTLEDVVEMSLIWEMLPETLPQIIQYSTTMLPDLMNLAPDPSETFNYISNYMDPEAPPPYTANPAPATIPQPMSASDPAINMQPLSHLASSLNTQISSISDPVITSQPVSSPSLPLPSDTDPGVIMRPCTCTECLRAAGLAMSIIIPVPTAYAILFITLKFCCV